MSNFNFWHPVVEKCGFILNNGEIIAVENLHPHPEVGFVIPKDLIEYYAESIMALWHSHPSDDINLSLEDHTGFLAFPQYEHHIYGLNKKAVYYVRDQIVYRRDDETSLF